MKIAAGRGLRVAVIAGLLCAGLLPGDGLQTGGGLLAGDGGLEIADGVVVKFGPDGELIVLDGLIVGGQAVCTSAGDDARGGPIDATPAAPAPGDWRGLRLERSAPASLTRLDGLQIFYAGRSGPAFVLRSTLIPLGGFEVGRSAGIGLQATRGTVSRLRDLILTGNQVGFSADDGSAPVIQSSVIAGNALFGLQADPAFGPGTATSVEASGVWWGHPGGPLDASDDRAAGGLFNPDGPGNAVSDGVSYQPVAGAVPLFGLALSPVGGGVISVPSATFRLRGPTAVAARLSLDPSFAGVPFQPLSATQTISLPPPDGLKTVHAEFQAATGNTAVISAEVRLDSAGPALAVARPAAGEVLTRPLTVLADASDSSGVARVEFYLDGVLLFTDTTNTFSFDWDIRSAGDGPHVLGVVAVDNVGKRTQRDLTVAVAAAPPAAPVITGPAGGTTTPAATIAVTGTAESGVTVALHANGSLVGRVPAGGDGAWGLASVALQEGTNSLLAIASDRVGSSPPSATISVTRDTGAPSPPAFLTIQGLEGGNKRLEWIRSISDDVASYSLYRSGSPFTSRSQATRLQWNIAGLSTFDAPAGEGTFHYAVTATDVTGNESEIGNLVQAVVDRTPPSATLTFVPSGTVGPGPVALTLVVSEPVVGDPFLSLTPQGGSPIPVALAPAAGVPLTWNGAFVVDSGMPSGPTLRTFFARDLTLNAGSAIIPGGPSGLLTLDTRGPAGTVAVTPAGPLGPGTHRARLTLDEPSSGTPILRFLPPSGGPVVLAPIEVSGGTAWDADLVVTPAMGNGQGLFELQASDRFGNVTSGLIAGAGVDLDTTPPDPPAAPAAVTLPAGRIRLTWPAVGGAASYALYRVPAGQPFDPGDPALVTGLTSPTHTDLPPADGSWTYAAAALDPVANRSALSAGTTAVSDRTAPGGPASLALAIEGNGIRAGWTPDAADPGDRFVLYRASSPITTIEGLVPVLEGPMAPTAFDRPPADGAYHYAVAARDAAGNESPFAAAGPITFDQAAPSITVGGVADGQVLRGPVTLVFSATDFSLESLSATLDGAAFESGLAVAAEGDHTLSVQAADASGNSAGLVVRFAIDDTAPLVTVDGVSDGSEYGVPVTPVIAIADPHLATSSVTLNGAPFVSGTTVGADAAYILIAGADDQAGNSTTVTVHFRVDAAPPAVASLAIDLPAEGYPVLSWPARPEPDVTGYLVARDGSFLTPAPQTALSFTDSTFDPFASHVYGVIAVDGAGHQGPPRTATVFAAGLALAEPAASGTLTRRYLDNVAVSIGNPGPSPLATLSLEMTLRDGGAVLGTLSRATTAALAPGSSATLGGVFSTGDGPSVARSLDVALTLPSEPQTRVRRLASFTLPVREPGPAIEVFNDPIVLGAPARITLKVLNHGSARMQVLTSQSGGPSPEVEVSIKDGDGNVLGSGRLDHRGAGVINTADKAFAELGPGGSYTSRPVTIQVPSTAPARVTVEAVVSATHSDLLGAADVAGPGLRGSAGAATGNPAYLATAVSDRSVYQQGEEVRITGQAFATLGGAPIPDAPVKVGVSTRGFDRIFYTAAGADGRFALTFTPVAGEAGSYTLWATHPSVTERASQATFQILGLALNPSAFNLRMSRNASFPIPVELRNTGETPLTGFTFEVSGGQGVAGAVDASALPAVLEAGRSARVVLTVAATIDADLANFATLDIATAEGVARTFEVNIALLPALPSIQADPSFVEAGLGNGSVVTRTVRIRNIGFAPLEDVVLDPPATAWITLGVGPALPPIPVGGFADVPVVFAPDAGVTPAIYSDRFVIHSGNHVPYTENLFAIVTSSTQGDAMFQVRNTENVLLDGASIWIQNLQVPTLTFTRPTVADGTATFADLPTGPYQYRIQATGTEPAVGKFEVESGQVAPVSVIMNVVYVSLEWSVTPILIEDRYDFTLRATFQTDVPAPVLVATPSSFNLQMAPGSVYIGEYTLTNHGLVAADDVRITPSIGAGAVLETLVTGLPRLGAKQSITVPFRLTRLPLGAAVSSPIGAAASSPATPGAAAGAASPQAVRPQADEPNPCDPIPGYISNYAIYVCLAGSQGDTEFNVNFSISVPPSCSAAFNLGFCDDECSLCDCLPGKAGALCSCLSGGSTDCFGEQGSSTCDCINAIFGDEAGGACSCLLEGDPLACLGLLGGAVGAAAEAVGAVLDAASCGIALAKCVCKYAPSVCSPSLSFGGGTPGTGGPGGLCCSGGGGYGGGYPGVVQTTGCGSNP